MIDSAVVFASTNILSGEKRDISPLTEIAGLSLLKRTLLTLHRAGIDDIIVITSEKHSERQEELKKTVEGDHRLTEKIRWVASEEEAGEFLHGGCLLLGVQAFFDWRIIKELEHLKSVDEIVRVGTNCNTSDGNAVEFLYLPESLLRQGQARGWGEDLPLFRLIREQILSGKVRVLEPSSGVYYTVDGTLSPRVTEKFLAVPLSRDNVLDGLVDRFVNRKVSPFLTLLFIRAGVSPNGITLISLAIGLFSALFFLRGGHQNAIIGALLFQFSAIVDCCDGEVARLTFRESQVGKWLDVICDNIVHIAIFFAIAWSTFHQAHERPLAYLVGALTLLGTLFSSLLVFSVLWRKGSAEEKKRIVRVIETIANRDFSVILLVCALFGQLRVFLWVTTVGLQIFWITVLSLILRTGSR